MTGGRVWFKVNGPGTLHEATLVAALGEIVPDLVPDVLAVDPARGWSLSRDAGPLMRSVAGPEDLWSRWEQILVRYAEAQILLGDHLTELLATGVHEASPTTLPDQAAALLDELGRLPVDQGGLSADEVDAVSNLLPAYGRWCAELADSGIPDSLQHDDLHSANICWPGSSLAARIIDWGDASIGFPLGTMLCTMNSISHYAGTGLDDPRVLSVRDAYLEPFTRFAERIELVRYVDLARRTGCVARALSYRAALCGEPISTHVDQDFPVCGWFLEILEP